MGHLILKRKVGQSITIGDDVVKVTVLRIKGSWVSLGITAPDNIDITRDDVGKSNRPEASSLPVTEAAPEIPTDLEKEEKGRESGQ